MKKKTTRTLWLIIALAASLAVIGGIYFLSVPRLTPLDEYAGAPAVGVQHIKIEGDVSHIGITTGSSGFKAHLYGESVSDNKFRARLSIEPDLVDPSALVIKEYRMAYFRFGNDEELWLDITVPNSFSGGVSVDSVSGPITANGLKTNALFVTSVSGEITLRNCAYNPLLSSVAAMSVSSGSGPIHLESMVTNQLDIQSTSGEISALGCNAHSFEVENISGSVELNDIDAGELIVSTSSGAIEANVRTLGQAARLDSVSGEIGLRFPEGLPLSFDMSSVSGEVVRNYPSTEAGIPVVVVTLSGNESVTVSP